MSRRNLLLAIPLAIFLLTIGSAQAAYSQADSPTIRYAYFKAFDPTFIAIEKGFFAKAGVKVELTGNFPTGPSTVQGGGYGTVDAGLCSITGTSLARASGIDVRSIADVQTEFRNATLERFYVKSDSPYQSIRDLKGKTIAVNGFGASFYYTWVVALRQNGMERTDVKFVDMPFANQYQALMTGAVDAIGLIDPFNKQAELSGGTRVLFKGIDVLGSKHISLIWFTSSFIAEHPAAVTKYVAAYRKAIRWIKDNPRGSGAIISRYTGIDQRFVARHRYTVGARIRLGDIQWWLDLLRDLGDLKDDGRLKPTDIATTRFTGK